MLALLSEHGEVGMGELCECACLAFEARWVCGEIFGEGFYGDIAVEACVVSEVDDAHAAAPDLAGDGVRADCGA